MATPQIPAAAAMLPYRKRGEIDYASLEFDPDQKNLTEDAMEQNLELVEMLGLFSARFTDFNRRPDVFLDNETFICYDPSSLNVRIAPDIYLAFGVDARAIRPRKIYLPWEVGKPPDFALEVASASTASGDVERKPGIYATIGVREFWRFDPSGRRYHGQPIWGGELVNGEYRELPQTREPDGVLKVYSPLLQVSICWDEGWPYLYDPATGTYDRNWRAEQAAAIAAEDQRDAAREERDVVEQQLVATEDQRDAAVERSIAAEQQRDAALAEVERLRELLRRRNGERDETPGDETLC